MITPEQLDELERLRNEAFDRNALPHAVEVYRHTILNVVPDLIKDLREARAEVARLRRWAERPPTSTANPGSAEAIRFAAQCRRDFGAAPALAPDAQPDDAVLP
jgi:hypothetical protein